MGGSGASLDIAASISREQQGLLFIEADHTGTSGAGPFAAALPSAHGLYPAGHAAWRRAASFIVAACFEAFWDAQGFTLRMRNDNGTWLRPLRALDFFPAPHRRLVCPQCGQAGPEVWVAFPLVFKTMTRRYGACGGGSNSHSVFANPSGHGPFRPPQFMQAGAILWGRGRT